jgi:nucleoside 2-deoxyribosyltransferase
MKKIYIAGPMRGYPDYNFPLFKEVAEELRDYNWEVINPAELDTANGFDTDRHAESIKRKELEDFIVRDVHLVMSCDAICVLPGWEKSYGVAVEVAVANYCGIPIFTPAGAVEENSGI